MLVFSDRYTVSSLVRFYPRRGNNFEALCTYDLMDPKCPCQYLTWMINFRNTPSIGRGDPSPVVLRRSNLAHTVTVELRFYNIITTINTIFLESVSFFITKV